MWLFSIHLVLFLFHLEFFFFFLRELTGRKRMDDKRRTRLSSLLNEWLDFLH